jgi:hypothetical protein
MTGLVIFLIILIMARPPTAPVGFLDATDRPSLSKVAEPMLPEPRRSDAGVVPRIVADKPAPAQIFGIIFSKLSAQSHDMPFGGDLANVLGLTQDGYSVPVREMPPLRGDAPGVVHIFFQLADQRGSIVVRYSTEELVAFRFGPDFNLIAVAERKNGQAATAVSDSRAAMLFDQETLECEDLVNAGIR